MSLLRGLCVGLRPHALVRSLRSSTLGRSDAPVTVDIQERAAYRHFEPRQTRWNDNDVFGHVNNVMYYAFIDDAVNLHLLKRGIDGAFPRFVVQSSCRYLRPISWPNPVDVGLRISRLGNSSANYEIGIFDQKSDLAAATATFVHVYVDLDGKPMPLDPRVREVLSPLLV
mmetsp:Transcript_15863/g.34447  ORF Transcript_15863/g.34447 Transcript_15863/m.34447 type:complete len:170 (-) Transcript_15863:289-798(-)